ncbi:MAG: TIGR02611 family protein [Pedococcus sp.]
MTDQTRGRTPEAMQRQDSGEGSAQHDKDWQWRRKIRSNPHSHLIYKWVVGVIGVLVVVVGIVLLPAPGPGWVIIFLGIGILASEFEKAQRLLDWAKDTVGAWNDWQKTQPLWVRGLLGLGTLLLVLLIFWALFAVSGVPGFLPGFFQDRLTTLPGL